MSISVPVGLVAVSVEVSDVAIAVEASGIPIPVAIADIAIAIAIAGGHQHHDCHDSRNQAAGGERQVRDSSGFPLR
ncbi:MAG: hypothetical protein J0G36_19505 [Afipia sp.]|nr:hypothetical protein [Afipia sp.]